MKLTRKLRALMPKSEALPEGYPSDLFKEALTCLDTLKGPVLTSRLSEIGLALAETPAAVQNMVAAGQVSATLALKTVRAGDTAKLTEAVKASGKVKVTAKHIGVAKPRKLDDSAVRELLRVLAGMVQPYSVATMQSLVVESRNILGE